MLSMPDPARATRVAVDRIGGKRVETGRKELGGRGREITAHLCLAAGLYVLTEARGQLKMRDRSNTTTLCQSLPFTQ